MITVQQWDAQGLPQVAGGEDAELVRAILDGRPTLFAVLMRRHNARVFRAARSITRDDAEAEDVVQHTFLTAHGHLSDYRGDGSLGAWLARIAVREAVRRRKRAARDRDVAELVHLHEAARPPQSTPELESERRKVRALLESFVDGLPDTYRPVFVLRDVQELSTRETADALELSEEAVRVRLHRARTMLRERLAASLDVPPNQLFGFAGERCNRIVAAVWRILEARRAAQPC